MLNNAIAWFAAREGKVTYSMVNRNGAASYDCSSAVYYALISAGGLPSMRIGNTDSLFGDLERNGWAQVKPDANGNFPTRRGDVFIWGARGASGGAAGHTGMFTDADNIIHCNYGYNTITVNNYDWLRGINGNPVQTFYRYVGGAKAAALNNPNDQVVDVGSTIKFTSSFRVDDLQLVNGIYQVYTKALCSKGFDWNENGIPVAPLTEVNTKGQATDDQNLEVGSLYIISGKYSVLDWGNVDGVDMAQIKIGGYDIWVDLAPATEIANTDAGTPIPAVAPKVLPPPPAPVVVPPKPPVVAPEVPKNEAPALPIATIDYSKENNTLLKQILAIVQSILNKITSVFK